MGSGVVTRIKTHAVTLVVTLWRGGLLALLLTACMGYRGVDRHTITGHVITLENIYSPELHNARDVLVYLPPSYTPLSERRYPVVYMQDGWNVFDAATSFAGQEWGADETAERLSAQGLETIIVAVTQDTSPSSFKRLSEYGPWPDLLGLASGQGGAYAAFLAKTLKPLVDRSFPTLPDAPHTALIGSSMGGLISLYTAFSYPDIYGFVGALSPALWFADGRMFSYLESRSNPTLRVYTDIGSQEHMGVIWDSPRFVRDTERLAKLLMPRVAALRWQVVQGADHSENQWQKRLPGVLEWFLTGGSSAQAQR